MSVVHVVLGDDHPLMLFGLAAYLGAEPDLVVVTAVGSWAELIAAVEQHQPEVVLVDMSMPDGSLVDALPELLKASSARVVCLSEGGSDDDAVTAALELGAAGVVSKQNNGAQLAASIRTAAAGQVVLDLRASGIIASHLRDDTRRPTLSPREHRVLERVAAGYPIPRIAADLQIAPTTVKSYLDGIYSKLRVHSRAAAVAVAKDLGLLADVSAD